MCLSDDGNVRCLFRSRTLKHVHVHVCLKEIHTPLTHSQHQARPTFKFMNADALVLPLSPFL